MAALAATAGLQLRAASGAPLSRSSVFGQQVKQLSGKPLLKSTVLRQHHAAVRSQQTQFDPLTTIKKAIDSTKVNLDEASIKQNMQKEGDRYTSVDHKDQSQAIDTTIDMFQKSIPRSELARRPETGGRDFYSVMAFDGPGPETINGRLAMLGVFWGLFVEATKHQTIFQQLASPTSPGTLWLLGVGNLIFVASLIPIFRGESTDSRRNGPFTAQAERWNGRTAMLGFAGLLFFEFVAGHPLLN
eukprot:SM000054S18134  [mRNA]  locus=s54:599232:601343:+ [translate_table: standard]